MDKTDKQAVYDIAAKLGYTGAEGPSVASAIYAVAQAKGYEGACEGDASQALQALYTVVGGGGGGGDLGALQYPPVFVNDVPVIGNAVSYDEGISFTRFDVGDTVAIDNLYGNVGQVAAGITAVAFLTTEAGLQVDAYVCTVEFDAHENMIYSTVTPWTGTVTEGQDEDGVTPWSLVIPELQDEASLFLYPHT